MFNLNDSWIINPLITRFETPKNVQVIKRHLNTLDKGINKFHLEKTQGKDIVTISGSISGFLLSECVIKDVRKHNDVTDFAFIEQQGKEVYFLIVNRNEVVLEVKSVESYIHMNALSFITKIQKSNDREEDATRLLPVFIAGEVSENFQKGIKDSTRTPLLIESIPLPLPINNDGIYSLQLIQNVHFPKIINSNIKFIAGGLIIILLVAFIFTGEEKEVGIKVVKAPESIFKALNNILTRTGVSVKGRMIQAYVNLNVIKKIELEGWSMETMTLTSDSTQIVLKRDGGS